MQSKKRNWIFLFSSNYWGILNDNFLKHCIIFTGVTWMMPTYITQSMLISLISAALIIPYLFFSPLGGQLAVLYSKQRVFLWCKVAEFPIMILAGIAFYFQSLVLSLLAVLLMGIQSCLYSPSKYGLIRDIGGEQGLSFGSGVFETMAFLGILSGTVIASLIADHYSFYLTVVLFMGFAVLGYVSVCNIRVKELEVEKLSNFNINPISFVKASYLYAKKYPYINCGVLGVSIFWLLGGLIQMNLVIHCKETLQTSNTVAGIMMAVAAVGIALGCSFAGRFSNNTVNTRMIFIGLLGMIVFLLGIVIFNPPVIICAIFVFLLAFMGGLFEVPCLALVQQANTGRKLGDILAYMNLIIFTFILAGSLIFSVTTHFSNENSLVVFGVVAGMCLITLIYFIVKYPQFLKLKIENSYEL
ncbi:MAG: MFS transporter [Bacteroidales bacterium]|jgi:acyl-[acyl-carrier-protein]-phospholipid O-acyltransferase/long-chain-fatty-acid--[acyl-carrier-protein] ligase|nr:MFS transporter [Bacteroidales bacterium]